MIKRELFVPIAAFILMTVFVVISVLVFLSRGNKTLLKQKLKLGAVIIALTGIVSCGNPVKSCYEQAPVKKDSLSRSDLSKKDTAAADTTKNQQGNNTGNNQGNTNNAQVNTNNVVPDTVYKPKTCYKPVNPNLHNN